MPRSSQSCHSHWSLVSHTPLTPLTPAQHYQHCWQHHCCSALSFLVSLWQQLGGRHLIVLCVDKESLINTVTDNATTSRAELPTAGQDSMGLSSSESVVSVSTAYNNTRHQVPVLSVSTVHTHITCKYWDVGNEWYKLVLWWIFKIVPESLICLIPSLSIWK